MTKIVLAFIVLAGFRGCTAHTHTISCGDLHTENKCVSVHGCWWKSKWRGNRELDSAVETLDPISFKG